MIQTNINLKAYNTMGINAFADNYCAVRQTSVLQNLILNDALKNTCFILGGGSNVLITGNINGLVLHNQLKGIKKIFENEKEIHLQVASGENWDELVKLCCNNHWGGIENLSLIPGTVGAAPIQNIGAYGVEIKDTLLNLEAIELATGKLKVFTNTQCQFNYRDSIFKNQLKHQYFITSVTLRLQKYPRLNFSYAALNQYILDNFTDKLSVKHIRAAVIAIRQSKLPDPKILPNTGSFFKNPVISKDEFEAIKIQHPNIPFYQTQSANQFKVPAGWLIESAGFKGKKFGKVGVFEKQALVIVNHNGGTADEILALVTRIQSTIFEKFGITLMPEVQLV